MAFNKVKDSEKQNGIVSDDLEEYVLDDSEDISSVPTSCAPGSVAQTADLNHVWVLSPSKVWVDAMAKE